MPTITTYRGFSFSNFGPLTTTFAPPASCSSGTTGVQIAFSDNVEGLAFMTNCGADAVQMGDCFPSGAAQDAVHSSIFPNPEPDVLAYFSPGLFCPSGWTTAGAATKTGDGAPSTTGAFSLIPQPTNGSLAIALFEPVMQALLDVLDADETAVLCCPSTATVNPLGYCYSTLPRDVYQPPPKACLEILPNQDIGTVTTTRVVSSQTVTDVVAVITGTAPVSPTTTTFAASVTAQLLGVTVFPMLTLVHKAADASSSGGGGGGESGSGGGGGPPTNAAGSLRAPDGGGFMGLWPLVCVAVAGAAGAAAVLL